MAGVKPELLAALADGAIAVTPNRRLARHLQGEFDAAQRAAGRLAWATPAILPYATWLELLWDSVAVSGDAAEHPLLLSPAQSAALWLRIIDASGATLLDPRGAAALAAEAWSLVHAWGTGGESWRAWRSEDPEPDDASTFAAWAEAYRAELGRLHTLDQAQLADALAAPSSLAAKRAEPAHSIVLVGFLEFTPQQERLFASLEASGGRITRIDPLPERVSKPMRISANSPRDELAGALAWARERALEHPGTRIGIVVENLAQSRSSAVALAEDILCPSAILPGAAVNPLPFEISLGIPLPSVPLVGAALALITLAESPLPSGAAAALLRSPYLPGAETAWPRRAAIESRWLESGQREVTLGDVIAALEAGAPDLATQWRAGRDALRVANRTTPRACVDAWRAWLVASGWPGSRPLDSAEFQARETWDDLLGQFATLGAVAPRITRAAAVDGLRALAGETLFQPEGGGASIQILGVLEATGLEFDALWCAGLTSDRWPPAPTPNPLLPMEWQRERGVPRSSAQRELAYAAQLTARFTRAADEMRFSSAARDGDRPVSPSALIVDIPEQAATSFLPSWTQTIADSATLECVADDQAPRPAPGIVMPGGSRIIAAQSDCPFQAVARHRLGAERWPESLAGLSPPERGTLLHAAMAAFWSVTTSHAALQALDAVTLAAAIDAAVQRGLAELPASRWRTVPATVRDGERRRLTAILGAWLALDRERPPFVVRDLETPKHLELAALTFRLRLDRVDALDGGGVAIIDYKSGQAESVKQWFDERPRAAQLGLYVLAQRSAAPELPVRAIAYAVLRPGGMAAVGVAGDADAWPGLSSIKTAGAFANWSAMEDWWRSHLGGLATEIAQGRASVTPRESPLPCRNCGLQALCRIESVRRLESGGPDE